MPTSPPVLRTTLKPCSMPAPSSSTCTVSPLRSKMPAGPNASMLWTSAMTCAAKGLWPCSVPALALTFDVQATRRSFSSRESRSQRARSAAPSPLGSPCQAHHASRPAYAKHPAAATGSP
eukprot:CAMPEP_0197932106 /NCGR_PEP_ID=MMETSP1439-20131203/108077_1 /TAXON_ID=66791 /ORGANISM="Gonyaulax spinifera, Strain CCMP409" /LENGTH=119 /DNA_ID=CAMNT_0043554873 /DNA_START=181 /DNA_END=543 /DNA_ORIENTATION=+